MVTKASIDIGSLGNTISWGTGTYTLRVPAGLLVETDNNHTPSIAQTKTFLVPQTAPSFVSGTTGIGRRWSTPWGGTGYYANNGFIAAGISFNPLIGKKLGTGYFNLYKLDGTLLVQMGVNDTDLVKWTANNDSVIFNITDYLDTALDNQWYYITYDAGVLNNLYRTGPIPALTSTSTISFANLVVTNMTNTNRTFVINNETQIFATNTPQLENKQHYYIYNSVTVLDTNHSVILSTSDGEFGFSQYGTDKASTFTISGSIDSINSTIGQVLFWPNVGATSGTVTYTQKYTGVTVALRTINLTGTTGSSTSTVITFSTASTIITYNPLYKFMKYGTADILVVGGGAGWGRLITTSGPNPYYNISGGGAGGVVEVLNDPVPSQFTLRVGGISTASGIQSYVVGYSQTYTASGGQQSVATVPSVIYGGTSGSPQSYAGGQSYYTFDQYGNFTGYGGGGGGAGGVGDQGGTFAYLTGRGGAGYVSTITGQTYAFGGDGLNAKSHRTWPYGSGQGSNTGGSSAGGNQGVVVIRLKI